MTQKIRSILLILTIPTILSGCLPALMTGAVGSTMEFAKDRPASETLSDNKIALAIKAAFVRNDFHALYTQIKVDVVQGRVLLTGTIDKEEDAINAVKICWNQKGVKKVINELKVDRNSRKFSLIQYTKDTMITSQIKSKTMFARDVKFVNYTVITSNNVVYLLGIARSEPELKKVAKIAANVSGVEKVVSHVNIQENISKAAVASNVVQQESSRSASVVDTSINEILIEDDITSNSSQEASSDIFSSNSNSDIKAGQNKSSIAKEKVQKAKKKLTTSDSDFVIDEGNASDW